MSFPETFYTIDVLFGLFVLLFGFAGLLRGLSGELARLLGFLFLLSGFCFFYPTLTQLAAQHWGTLSPVAVQVIVGLILLLIGLLVFFALRVVLTVLFRQLFKGVVDRLFGGLFGLLFGALLGLSVFSSLSLIPDEEVYRMLSEKSVVGAWVCERLAPWLYPRLMELPVFDREEN